MADWCDRCGVARAPHPTCVACGDEEDDDMEGSMGLTEEVPERDDTPGENAAEVRRLEEAADEATVNQMQMEARAEEIVVLLRESVRGLSTTERLGRLMGCSPERAARLAVEGKHISDWAVRALEDGLIYGRAMTLAALEFGMEVPDGS